MGRQSIIVLAACIVSVAGCGKNEVTYNAGDAKVAINRKGDTATIVESAGGSAAKTTISSANALPVGFPRDVPVFKDAAVQLSSIQEAQMNVVFRAPAPLGEVLAFYQKALQAEGWTIDTSISTGDAAAIEASKGKRKLNAGLGKEGEATTLTLSLEKDQS